MHSLHQFMDFILHIDIYLNAFVSTYGFWTYLVLFLVIFCETGLVVTPFLPGDSLLFAAGSIAAQPNNSFNVGLLFLLLFIASILGNHVNFLLGKFIGPRVFSSSESRFFSKKNLQQAHLFYEQHGGKALILARFIPIIRTFAPFIAGVSAMKSSLFTRYNILGALLWIGSLLAVGYCLGSLPIVKRHFSLVIYAIVIISLLPALITVCTQKIMHAKK